MKHLVLLLCLLLAVYRAQQRHPPYVSSPKPHEKSLEKELGMEGIGGKPEGNDQNTANLLINGNFEGKGEENEGITGKNEINLAEQGKKEENLEQIGNEKDENESDFEKPSLFPEISAPSIEISSKTAIFPTETTEKEPNLLNLEVELISPVTKLEILESETEKNGFSRENIDGKVEGSGFEGELVEMERGGEGGIVRNTGSEEAVSSENQAVVTDLSPEISPEADFPTDTPSGLTVEVIVIETSPLETAETLLTPTTSLEKEIPDTKSAATEKEAISDIRGNTEKTEVANPDDTLKAAENAEVERENTQSEDSIPIENPVLLTNPTPELSPEAVLPTDTPSDLTVEVIVIETSPLETAESLLSPTTSLEKEIPNTESAVTEKETISDIRGNTGERENAETGARNEEKGGNTQSKESIPITNPALLTDPTSEMSPAAVSSAHTDPAVQTNSPLETAETLLSQTTSLDREIPDTEAKASEKEESRDIRENTGKTGVANHDDALKAAGKADAENENTQSEDSIPIENPVLLTDPTPEISSEAILPTDTPSSLTVEVIVTEASPLKIAESLLSPTTSLERELTDTEELMKITGNTGEQTLAKTTEDRNKSGNEEVESESPSVPLEIPELLTDPISEISPTAVFPTSAPSEDSSVSPDLTVEIEVRVTESSPLETAENMLSQTTSLDREILDTEAAPTEKEESSDIRENTGETAVANHDDAFETAENADAQRENTQSDDSIPIENLVLLTDPTPELSSEAVPTDTPSDLTVEVIVIETSPLETTETLLSPTTSLEKKIPDTEAAATEKEELSDIRENTEKTAVGNHDNAFEAAGNAEMKNTQSEDSIPIENPVLLTDPTPEISSEAVPTDTPSSLTVEVIVTETSPLETAESLLSQTTSLDKEIPDTESAATEKEAISDIRENTEKTGVANPDDALKAAENAEAEMENTQSEDSIPIENPVLLTDPTPEVSPEAVPTDTPSDLTVEVIVTEASPLETAESLLSEISPHAGFPLIVPSEDPSTSTEEMGVRVTENSPLETAESLLTPTTSLEREIPNMESAVTEKEEISDIRGNTAELESGKSLEAGAGDHGTPPSEPDKNPLNDPSQPHFQPENTPPSSPTPELQPPLLPSDTTTPSHQTPNTQENATETNPLDPISESENAENSEIDKNREIEVTEGEKNSHLIDTKSAYFDENERKNEENREILESQESILAADPSKTTISEPIIENTENLVVAKSQSENVEIDENLHKSEDFYENQEEVESKIEITEKLDSDEEKMTENSIENPNLSLENEEKIEENIENSENFSEPHIEVVENPTEIPPNGVFSALTAFEMFPEVVEDLAIRTYRRVRGSDKQFACAFYVCVVVWLVFGCCGGGPTSTPKSVSLQYKSLSFPSAQPAPVTHSITTLHSSLEELLASHMECEQEVMDSHSSICEEIRLMLG